MNTCETCRYYMASPLQEPCESCHWDGVIGHDPPNWKGPTNADRIRAMTDAELAEFIESIAPAKGWSWFLQNGTWLDWLKKEDDAYYEQQIEEYLEGLNER